jgi:hypothetical protein
MVEHHSYKIQNVIQKVLFNAKQSIKIVVAWFTNDLLFQPLVLKQLAGVKVEIILNRDEINCSEDNNVDFKELVNAGGVIRWNDTKQLMHDKFCIVDDSIVIYGSYNWTNKAEYNEESITVSRNEPETTRFYLEKLRKLSEKYPADKISESTIYKPIIQTVQPSKNIDINTLSKQRKSQPYIWKQCCSINMNSNTALNFYEKLELVRGVSVEDSLIAKMNGSCYFINPYKMTPYNDVEFSEYKREHKMGDGAIWLKVSMKWGLFVTTVRKFAFEPICDEIQINDGCTAFRIDKSWGLMDNHAHILLDCKYDEVHYKGNGEYEIKKDGKVEIYKSESI